VLTAETAALSEATTVIRAAYEAWNRGSAVGLQDVLDPSIDCSWVTPGGATERMRGSAVALDRAQREWSRRLVHISLRQLIASDEDVVALVHLTYRQAPLGPARSAPALHLWTVRDHRVVSFTARPLRVEPLGSWTPSC